MRQFYPNWFKGQHSKWLEYSKAKDAAYCLCCYLFKNEHETHGNMGDVFTKNGFKAWNKAIERFKTHVGGVDSIHNKCFNKMIDLMNQSQSIRSSFERQSEKEKSGSRCRLNASINVARFLLRLGLPFRGHDESRSSTNRGIFLELLQWYGDIDRDVGRIILENAPKNEMMCSPIIQKDIVDACSKEIIKAIIEDLDGDFFGILVDEFESLMNDASSLCDKHEIIIPQMDAPYFPRKSKRRANDVTYSRHLRVDIFYAVIDLHLQELNSRFDAVSTDLFLGMAFLNPANSFGNFDKNRIMRLAEHYRKEFDSSKLRDLSCQLDSFIVYVRGSDERFFNMKGISDLAKVLVKSDLHQTWPLVYLLIKLTLILPVATASVERAFSSMNYIKNELRNSIGDEFLNGYLVCYVERKIFATVSNDAIIDRFQHMKSRRAQL